MFQLARDRDRNRKDTNRTSAMRDTVLGTTVKENDLGVTILQLTSYKC